MNSNEPRFYLYSTLGCHLCDDAEALVRPVADYLQCRFSKVDIADSDSLITQYGIRIPVLYHRQSGAELGWPFDSMAVLEFMESNRA